MIIKFIDLTPGDRFKITGNNDYALLTKINSSEARWHSTYSLQGELHGEDESHILPIDADVAVDFIPAVIK